jgi:hypothetical protein
MELMIPKKFISDTCIEICIEIYKTHLIEHNICIAKNQKKIRLRVLKGNNSKRKISSTQYAKSIMKIM